MTPGNARSCRLLERHGFNREGVLRDYGYWKGRFLRPDHLRPARVVVTPARGHGPARPERGRQPGSPSAPGRWLRAALVRAAVGDRGDAARGRAGLPADRPGRGDLLLRRDATGATPCRAAACCPGRFGRQAARDPRNRRGTGRSAGARRRTGPARRPLRHRGRGAGDAGRCSWADGGDDPLKPGPVEVRDAWVRPLADLPRPEAFVAPNLHPDCSTGVSHAPAACTWCQWINPPTAAWLVEVPLGSGPGRPPHPRPRGRPAHLDGDLSRPSALTPRPLTPTSAADQTAGRSRFCREAGGGKSGLHGDKAAGNARRG